MRANGLRHYLNVERSFITGQDTLGHDVKEWLVIYEDVPASIETLSGRKQEIARQSHPTASEEIQLRYVGLHPHDRLNWNGQIYRILEIKDKDQKHQELTLTCETELASVVAYAISGTGGITIGGTAIAAS